MSRLYLRIWLTVLLVLGLFAAASSWLWQRHVEQERARLEQGQGDRLAAWADLIQRSLPAAGADAAQQSAALREWAQRLRMPMALSDAAGQRIAASEAYQRMEDEGFPRRPMPIKLDDGRTLWIARPGLLARMPPPEGRGSGPGWGEGRGLGLGLGPGFGPGPPRGRLMEGMGPMSPWPFGLAPGLGLALLLGLLFVLMAAASYPLVRGLTRRLEELKQGVDAFGAGALGRRVSDAGGDEVAAVARSFNQAAQRVEGLVRSHQSLLANASHELRSPLARLKLAVSLYEQAPPGQREALRREIDTNVAELDALVEEVLLASRLDAAPPDDAALQSVDLLALAAEEAARLQVPVDLLTDAVMGSISNLPTKVLADERLLRRAVRNLLENARRYGGQELSVQLRREAGQVQLWVCDRGPGVPEAFRERIFEAFFRLPGHAEREGGVGLGLSQVRQIAQHHAGTVRCQAREGGGSCFVLSLPAA